MIKKNKNVFIMLVIFILFSIVSCSSPKIQDFSKTTSIYDEINLCFNYENYDSFVSDYETIKDKFSFHILIPNKEFSDKYEIKYEMEGVGQLTDKGCITDISRGISLVEISCEYYDIDYENNIDYFIDFKLLYKISLNISNYNDKNFELVYDNDAIRFYYNENCIAEGKLNFGNGIVDKQKESFIDSLEHSIIYI